MRIFSQFVLLVFILWPSFLLADDGYSRFSHKGGPVQVVVALGVTFGGDDLLKFSFEDSDRDELVAGEFLDFKMGLSYRIPNQPFALQATAGYHFDTIDASDGDATLERVPLEFSFLSNYGDHVFGIGVTHHTAIQSDIRLPAGTEEVDGETVQIIAEAKIDYEDATGFFLEYGYEVYDNLTFAFRYVDLDYEEKRDGETFTFDANHFGIYGIVNF